MERSRPVTSNLTAAARRMIREARLRKAKEGLEMAVDLLGLKSTEKTVRTESSGQDGARPLVGTG
jgi:hypothetical protein